MDLSLAVSPQILWPELWVRPEHGGYGIDPLKPPAGLDSRLEQLGRNALTRTALSAASGWVLPTHHQAQSLPPEFIDRRLHVIHEGIDTRLAHPKSEVSFEVRGIRIDRSVPNITFVNRNLERLRGFDLFMRSLPLIQLQHPNVRVLIVGDNEAGYGGGHGDGPPASTHTSGIGRSARSGANPLPCGFPTCVDGVVSGQLGSVYLVFPFVMGWSLLEAMAVAVASLAVRACQWRKRSSTTLKVVWFRWTSRICLRRKCFSCLLVPIIAPALVQRHGEEPCF